MISLLFNPTVFFSMLLGLFVISMLVVFNLLRETKKETVTKHELEKNTGNLQQEIERLKKELSLKEELYQGLKGQYDELERDVEKITNQPQPTETAQPKTQEPTSNKPSIIDLLKSLNKTEN